MRAEAIVDLSAIKHNVELLKKTAGTKLLAVVKADAYGHGLVPVAKAAISAGADYLGVALLEEAIALREAGIEVPILAWLVQPGTDFKKAIELDIDVAAASLKALQEISDASENKKARVHLEVDTGMTRGGFLSEWDQLTAEHLHNIEVVGIFSHFARADEPGEAQNEEQLARFNEMVELVHSFGFTNAAAFDMVRTGIAMYGLSPDVTTLGNSQSLALRPAMQIRAAIYLVKDVPADTPVGYGASESTSADTKLGVIAMGYADGIPRIAHGAGVWSAGKKAFSIGRVSMDQFVVDLGAQSKAQSGDWVVIFGNGSHGEFTADDWGAASQTINYEIVTRIGPRVPRIYAAHVY
jgi:alanine racemase